MASPAPPELLREIDAVLSALESQNLYERLGVGRDAETKAIRKIYMKFAAKWHPDRLMRYELGPSEAKVQRLFALYTEAHTTLSDKTKREEYNAQLDFGGEDGEGPDISALIDADNQFRMGEQLLERGNSKGALKKFELACKANPESIRFQAYRSWAFYASIQRDEDGQPIEPKQNEYAKECKRVVQQAVDEIENFDMAHVFLGKMMAIEGNVPGAKKEFRTALKMNSKNLQAQRQLRLHNMREEESKGFFEKLMERFKKKDPSKKKKR